jgi:hypothetical protein
LEKPSPEIPEDKDPRKASEQTDKKGPLRPLGQGRKEKEQRPDIILCINYIAAVNSHGYAISTETQSRLIPNE